MNNPHKKRYLLYRILCLSFLSFFFSSILYAGEISISVGSQLEIRPAQDQLGVRITISNSGDELAREVQISLPNLKKVIDAAQVLPANSSYVVEFTLSLSELGIRRSGIYMLPYLVLYRDPNYFPFSSPQILELTVIPASTHKLSLQIKHPWGKTLPLDGVVYAVASIENLEQHLLQIEQIQLFSANELEVKITLPTLPLSLKAKEKLDLPISLQNRTALPGSIYPAFIIVSAESQGRHYSANSEVSLLTKDTQINLSSYMQSFILAIALLVLLRWAFLKARGIKLNSRTTANR